LVIVFLEKQIMMGRTSLPILEETIMKRFVYASLLVLLLLSACSTLAPAPATSTPVPTDTPQPTATPLPTDTPTAVPTSTPDKAATAAAQATETSDAILSELDEVLGESDVPYQAGHLAWKQDKPMKVSLSGPSWDYMELDKKLAAGNFILKSDITWEASGIIVCGFIFRSEPDLEEGKQYHFAYLRLSGLPAWEIEVYDFGRFKNTPTKTQYSDAIDQANGATNQVILVAQDEKFLLYLNRADQGRYFDYSKQRMDGSFAFEGSQDSGKGSCTFENSWIWALE
jgi:hypothetical protein